jgi:large subunit ribosomal protein L32e
MTTKFIMQDRHKHKELKDKWRRPRGLHSKIRLAKKGHIKKVSRGFRTAVSGRYLHHSGKRMVLVNAVAQLDLVDPKKDGIIIGGGVGNRKKITIINKANELKVQILNLKDPAAFVSKVEGSLNAKKAKKQEKQKKDIAQKESSKTKPETLDTAIEKTEDEKKEEEKKEKDKVLTKRV